MSEEEIIDIIEEILQDPFVYFSQDSSYESVQIRANAIEELLKKYKQQQKEIDTYKETENDYEHELVRKDGEIEKLKIELVKANLKVESLKIEAVYDNNYISKDKIREKIKKEEKYQETTKKLFQGSLNYHMQKYAVEVLKELLEE